MACLHPPMVVADVTMMDMFAAHGRRPMFGRSYCGLSTHGATPHAIPGVRTTRIPSFVALAWAHEFMISPRPYHWCTDKKYLWAHFAHGASLVRRSAVGPTTTPTSQAASRATAMQSRRHLHRRRGRVRRRARLAVAAFAVQHRRRQGGAGEGNGVWHVEHICKHRNTHCRC